MTDNKAVLTKMNCAQVNRADGLGIAELKKMGYKQIILSTEKLVVAARATARYRIFAGD